MNELKPGADLHIRPYRAEDQASLEWLYQRTPPWGRTYPRPQPIPDDLRSPLDHYLALFVAIEQTNDGEAVVGMAAAEQPGTDAMVPIPPFIDLSAARTVRIRHVAVAPERWRLGIGRRLMEAAIDWAQESAYESIILETTMDQLGAVALYDALSFSRLGQSVVGPYELVWFGRRL